jgi:hypothetical protein
MKTYLVIKIPVKTPTDLINATSVQLAGGTVDYLRGVVDGDALISFETVSDDSSNSSTNDERMHHFQRRRASITG